MKPFIILRIFKDNKLVEVRQFDQEQVVIGHDAEVTLDLNSTEVSPIHCVIERRDNGYYICDLGSQSGTFKNGQAVLDEMLDSGDEIRISSFKLIFYPGIPKPKTVPTSSEPATSLKNTIKNEAHVVLKEAPKNQTAVVESAIVKADVNKPEIKMTSAPSKKINSKKTFAPLSEVKNLKSYLGPGKGSNIEVIVAWKERILQTYHYRRKQVVQTGSHADQVALPSTLIPKNWKLLEIGSQVVLTIPAEAQAEVIQPEKIFSWDDLIKSGKVQQKGSKNIIRLEQNEVIFVSWPQSSLVLVIRFSSSAPLVPLLPPWLLSGSELAGIVASIILVILLALYMSAVNPEGQTEDAEETERVAQVIFNKPPTVNPPPPPVPVVEKEPPPPPKPVPPPPPKVAKLDTEKREEQNKGKPNQPQQAQKAQSSSRAAEVAPKPLQKNQPKKFTSTKQGGAIKTGEKAGANAKSANEDLSKVGLFSTFGGGGARSKIDQAYSGAGEVLGMADKATGTSGFNENRPGDDLGSKFKDTGAGGKGTATQGIAGVGTKGRSNGQGLYGSTDGFGDKSTTRIEAGGAEESFSPSIDKEAVRRVIRARLLEVRSCYDRELSKMPKGQAFEGRVVIGWTIASQGIATNAKVVSSTLNNRNVENCVRDRLSSWVFPEPPEGFTADISYPFLFKQN